jgi:hypothetical protein
MPMARERDPSQVSSRLVEEPFDGVDRNLLLVEDRECSSAGIAVLEDLRDPLTVGSEQIHAHPVTFADGTGKDQAKTSNHAPILHYESVRGGCPARIRRTLASQSSHAARSVG